MKRQCDRRKMYSRSISLLLGLKAETPVYHCVSACSPACQASGLAIRYAIPHFHRTPSQITKYTTHRRRFRRCTMRPSRAPVRQGSTAAPAQRPSHQSEAAKRRAARGGYGNEWILWRGRHCYKDYITVFFE